MSKDKVPECPCGGQVVLSSAGGKNFYYCRGCKKEIEERSSYGYIRLDALEEELDQVIGNFNIAIPCAQGSSKHFQNAGHLLAAASNDCTACGITHAEWIKQNFPPCLGKPQYAYPAPVYKFIPFKVIYDPFQKKTVTRDKEYD